MLCRYSPPLKSLSLASYPGVPPLLLGLLLLPALAFRLPAPVFLIHASPYPGLTPEEKGTVLRLRSLVKGHVSSLCGDLSTSEMWRKYGAVNSVTKNFDFQPDW